MYLVWHHFLVANSVTMVFNMAARCVLSQWSVMFDNSYKTAKGMDELEIEKWNQYLTGETYCF